VLEVRRFVEYSGSQVLSSPRHEYRQHVEKIVRSRELALINGPLRVKEDGGNCRRHTTSIDYTLKKSFAVGS